MLTAAELQERLIKLKHFSDAYDELDTKMQFARGQAWMDVRRERDMMGDAYISLTSDLYNLGYRIKYNKDKDAYDALNVFEGVSHDTTTGQL